jgi:glycerate dehydrogenase
MNKAAPKIVILDGRALASNDLSWAALEALGQVEVHEQSAAQEVATRARGAAVLITNKAPITGAVIGGAPDLRFIAVTATGFDCVDLAAARRRDIPVANVPEYGTDSVAQFTFALLLTLCHHVEMHVAAVRAGDWERSGDFSFWKTPQVELAGKTMGIAGFGRIGRRVGELAHAFGMPVLAADAFRSAAPAYTPFAWVELDELFARSDVISLHCPLTPETAGLVNRQRLSRVKPGAVLLNASRGGLVVEADLAAALNEGRLAGAAVDVVSQEPVRPENPLLSARNCLITPHIAWASREARGRLLDTTVTNIKNFLAGRPTNVVNP